MSPTNGLYLFACLPRPWPSCRSRSFALSGWRPQVTSSSSSLSSFSSPLGVPRAVSPPPRGLLTVAGSMLYWMVSVVDRVSVCLRNVGTFAEFIDRLLRDEQRLSMLATEYAKLQRRYRDQRMTLAALNRSVHSACKEHHERWREFPSVASEPRRHAKISPVEVQDKQFAEPPTLVKMCKCPLSPLCPLLQHRASTHSRLRVAFRDCRVNIAFSYHFPGVSAFIFCFYFIPFAGRLLLLADRPN
ncbi:hypothetical protein C8A03DRAFT_18672 [Achaetomium macrosporum]|uniref:Uncharacterized protein n=1 Tax=Achaetomium macrosporum TaxID=79813 RepID=A0AAN7C463_9PEZI|nr:hypothetical protein C8A03DRAFT_18672 [Achaetomium macrosporum]